ncbi:uncharacterized protein PHACADRAFT_208907 [Phanerochaete carnosa HHB-10118-sp]|uniref:Anaphase-promoting complex subunit 5 n=1 Tax=Phanerochaete carnosa (strain HHB-10118-sp) TaxID=650164 RepID=K5WY29_PHACS|nr:uncharacterized protein PHACADRAFT_208907 [Phanerochaete carnosa HHB-10118-sp]EKM55387.1 hypothetical protein PHACADRAFT_208907 [Phanerochaete carnosa HHB-10118-sp]
MATLQNQRAQPHPNAVPPPIAHDLKPHHVNLLNIFVVLFCTNLELPSSFLLHAYRILISEVAECRQPANFQQIMANLREGAKGGDEGVVQVLTEIETWPKKVITPDTLVVFFQALQSLFVGREEDEGSRFARRSLFGYFTRRCYVTFTKLSFEAVSALWHEFHHWILGRLDETTYRVRKDLLNNSFHIMKTDSEKKEYAYAEDYALWELGLATGDEIIASEHLRKFFEQHFHDQNDSGLRQHALLNMARMHFLRHEYPACRKLLQEAITTARTCNDRLTLQHCTSLMNRLPSLERGKRPLINEIQADLHPWEVLYDVKKLLTVGFQQPLSASFERMTQASVLYDAWSDTQNQMITEAEQWGAHAVESVAWNMMGNNQLAEVEDCLVTALTEAGSPDNTILASNLNRAYRRARQGEYQEAIADLLEPRVWAGLTAVDIQQWANEIWHVLVLRATRRGQEHMYHEFLLPKRPPGTYHPREYWFGSGSQVLGSLIRDPLFEVIAAKQVKQVQNTVESLLNVVWHAEFQQRFGSYRTALVLLADVGLEYGMTKWCRRLIEDIMPQVINGDDLEQRAFACFTLARCIIVSEDSKPEALENSLRYLDIAEKDYATLEMFRAVQDTQFLLSVVYHNLDRAEERDSAATRHQETEQKRLEAEKQVAEPWVTEVLDIVSEVSVALAAR